jgi:AcrR family transcriptional regulator
VLESALELIDREPPEAFTMRRVAEQLGMGVMTLYGYVRNKEEMVEGVTSLAFAKLGGEAPAGGDWESRIRAEVEQLYAVSRRHPHLVTVILAQASASPGLFRLRERLLATLLSAGFEEQRALQALGVLTSYAVGFGGLRASAMDLPERIGELPAAHFPRLHEAADRYATHLGDDAFDYGLGLLIAGLSSELEASGATGG